MLRVLGALAVELPCIIEVDLYVPLQFETYIGVPPVARAFLIGNSRSLLKTWVECDFFLLRGMDLVIFDRILLPEEVGEESWEEELEGLPLIDPASIPDDVTEEHVDFGVALVGDTLVIDWADTPRFDQIIRFHSVRFYVAAGELRRVAFCALSASQQARLADHIARRLERRK